jgi:hypothetical protein
MSHLIRKSLEKYDHSRRDSKDRRKKVAWAVFSYYERDTGQEYRKSFTAPADTPESKFWDIAPRIIINV